MYLALEGLVETLIHGGYNGTSKGFNKTMGATNYWMLPKATSFPNSDVFFTIYRVAWFIFRGHSNEEVLNAPMPIVYGLPPEGEETGLFSITGDTPPWGKEDYRSTIITPLAAFSPNTTLKTRIERSGTAELPGTDMSFSFIDYIMNGPSFWDTPLSDTVKDFRYKTSNADFSFTFKSASDQQLVTYADLLYGFIQAARSASSFHYWNQFGRESTVTWYTTDGGVNTTRGYLTTYGFHWPSESPPKSSDAPDVNAKAGTVQTF